MFFSELNKLVDNNEDNAGGGYYLESIDKVANGKYKFRWGS